MRGRISAAALVLLACGAVLACGEKGADVADASLDDGSVDSGRGDGGTQPSAECQALKNDLDALRDTALGCCITCDSIQCQTLTEDVCCSISTTGEHPDFVAAVRAYKSRCGVAGCPPVPCSSEASRKCEASPGVARGGRCR